MSCHVISVVLRLLGHFDAGVKYKGDWGVVIPQMDKTVQSLGQLIYNFPQLEHFYFDDFNEEHKETGQKGNCMPNITYCYRC